MRTDENHSLTFEIAPTAEGPQSARDMQTLFELVEASKNSQEQRLQGDIQREWEKKGEISDRFLLRRIGYSSQRFFDALVAQHPAKPIYDKVANVNRAFDILTRAREKFLEVLGQFHAQVLHEETTKIDRDAVLAEATMHSFTYCCAAVSLVQAYRHLVSGTRFQSPYDDLIKSTFSGKDVVRFVSSLRNNSNHAAIIEASPHYTISFGERKEAISGISFDRGMILKSEGWTVEARRYVEEKPDLQVVDVINEHYALAKEFHRFVFARVGIVSDSQYGDLLRLLHVRRTAGQIMSLGILLQVAVPKKIDPYPHLSDTFSEHELERIFSLPCNSAEQLDYMISVLDPLHLFDDNTKQSLDKLFGVTRGDESKD